ncbi:hypothetical protein [Marinobacter lipolyticus]|uniref:hypothetical protein n=1 Tax=Marinobacter lipolyticus TaxID=209639 RepID=UPI0006873C08|nr:hypothetical protein [Marinobacter lipolyticus]
MPRRWIGGATVDLPEVAMHLNGLVAAMIGVLLLCTALGVGWARDTSDHRPAGSVPEAPHKVADSGVTVIERTLGEGPAGTIVVRQGTTVRLVLHSPTGVELHLHGYNLSGSFNGKTPVVMNFRADHAGRFPIEAHGLQDLLGRTDSVLAYLEVRPE